MKIIGINGSPRKNHNTSILLQKSLAGAESLGSKTEYIHLHDLTYKGCMSCFTCKRKEGKSYGICSYQDELTPILEKIAQADALLLASPIYFMSMSGLMRSFIERLLFPYISYTEGYRSIFPRKIAIGCIYTMNLTADQMDDFGLRQYLQMQEKFLAIAFGSTESLIVNDTYQFDDYTKYVAPIFDEQKKADVRNRQFPVDCDKAFKLGQKLVQYHN